MRYEIRESNGLVQVTYVEERWYHKKDSDIFAPSITYVVHYYPRGAGFDKWLADKGMDDAEAIKKAAGDKGSRIHAAIEDLLSGKEITFDKKYFSKEDGTEKDLSVEEWEALLSFSAWHAKYKPKVLRVEETVFQDPTEDFKSGFAGTVDLVCEIEGELYIIDFKTSKDIYPSHRLQVSAYKHIIQKAYPERKINLAILQVGYPRNKNRYKFTEIDDEFETFKAVYKIWECEVKYKKPLQKDLPIKIKL
ncbi:TPA: hypothetical protein HA234_07305 [Candidatus Woesearchaeota archaeon]|nr:hypothetical protein [Candidatus Woesearchaeota archaeon]